MQKEEPSLPKDVAVCQLKVVGLTCGGKLEKRQQQNWYLMTAHSKRGISLPCSHFHDVQTCLLCKRMCLDTQRGVVARAKKIGSGQSKASSAKGMRQEEPSLPNHAVCPSNAVSLSFTSRWLAEGGGEAKLAYSTGELTKTRDRKLRGNDH